MGDTPSIVFFKLVLTGILAWPLQETASGGYGRFFRSIPLPEEAESFTPVYRCGEIGKEMVSNFVNKNYPDTDVSSGDCRFRLVITNPHVCQVRVDFVDTELLPPVKGDCLSQQFEVEGPIWPTGLPPLCGVNSDQHFYLHLEPWSTNLTWLDFRLSTVISGNPYRFGLWISQIDCSGQNPLKAPEGCTQYFLAEKGIIKTFNYEGNYYLHGQNYRICIRAGKGVCGIRYDAGPEDFSVRKSTWPITKDLQYKAGNGRDTCALDYLVIPNVSASRSRRLPRNRRLPGRRQGRFFFRRRAPSVVWVNNPPSNPAPAAAAPAPQTVLASSTVKSLTGKKDKLNTGTTKLQAQSVNQIPYNPDPERFCGGTLSPSVGETASKPISAKVRSNLIYLQFVAMSTAVRKQFKQTKLLNVTTKFRITYSQTRVCDTVEADLASQGNILNLLHSLGADPHNYHHDLPSPIVRDTEMLLAGSSTDHMVHPHGPFDGNMTEKTGIQEDGGDIPPEEDPLWDYLDESYDASNSNEDNDSDQLYDF